MDKLKIDIVKTRQERAYTRLHSLFEERAKFLLSAAETPVNYPERRNDFGKPVSKTTIANYVLNIKIF
ncbi:hypothetical protein [Lysinibacillus cavernae]|uniref:hypothetical protein n=1 Tax=Lysinibacillus cavernae TaxID=2666135 RepID=UPI0012D97CFA|nr:hypothetical protein [Lysinibacillus cavernae]